MEKRARVQEAARPRPPVPIGMRLTTAGVTLAFLVGLVQNFSALRRESAALLRTNSRREPGDVWYYDKNVFYHCASCRSAHLCVNSV